MRAGLLREFLTFQSQSKTQGASGAIKFTWTNVCTLRAWKKNVVAGEEFNQKEAFTSERWTFQMRYDNKITSDMHVVYNGVTYKIVGVPDKQVQDNTMIVIITKIEQ